MLLMSNDPIIMIVNVFLQSIKATWLTYQIADSVASVA